MTELYWMHDDALTLPKSCEGIASLYVFDDETIRYHGYGLKRLGFIYETLLSLPVEIQRGETVPTILAAMEARGATALVTVNSPCPRIKATTAVLQAKTSVKLIEPTPFVVPQKKLDLKRFSRYWRKVEKQALEPTATLI